MPKQSLLAKIHIARHQLAMDDEAYRALLTRVAGVSSSRNLSDAKATAVLNEFQRLGWNAKRTPKSKGKPHNFGTSMPEMITKVEALLADMDLPWAYADGIAKQMFGIQRVAWVRDPKQLKAIIAALYNVQKKRAGSPTCA